MPTVFSNSSMPVYLLRFHSPRVSAACAGLTWRAVEPAELAVDRADVGRIQVHVADEVRAVAVLALADDVGHRSDGDEILRAEKTDTVVT